MATNCCACPTRRLWVAGVIATRLTVGAGLTVIVAVPDLPPPLTVMVVDPTPAAVAVTAAPVVADRGATALLPVLQVSVTDGIALFDASKACAVRFTVAPAFSVVDDGLTAILAT